MESGFESPDHNLMQQVSQEWKSVAPPMPRHLTHCIVAVNSVVPTLDCKCQEQRLSALPHRCIPSASLIMGRVFHHTTYLLSVVTNNPNHLLSHNFCLPGILEWCSWMAVTQSL